jgi:hypothetical protein
MNVINRFVAAHQLVVYAFVLIAITMSLYGLFLGNPLIFDDLTFFMLDEEGSQPISRYQITILELRSLPYASLAWTQEWFGDDLIAFRMGNVLLHVGTVLALFLFSVTLLSIGGSGYQASNFNFPLASFFSALLFGLSPVATYAAGYLVQRTILMATLFCLLAMLTYVHGSIRQKSAWLWMSVPFYYLAVFAKEHAIMLPSVLLALTVLLHEDWREKLKQRWAVFASLIAIAVFVLMAKKGLIGSVYELNAPEMLRVNNSELAYPLSVITQAGLFFKYGLLWLFPNPDWMSIDMREPFAKVIWSPYLIAFVLFVSWGLGALYLLLKRGRLGLIGFAMLFPWLMFMTELSTVRIQEQFVLYRSYLWAVGIFVGISVLLTVIHRKMAVLLLLLMSLACFAVAMERLGTMSHPFLLWDDAEKLVKGRTDLPGAYRIYYNRGTELVKMDRLDMAILDLERAIALSADFPSAYGNLGVAYIKQREWVPAINSFSKAIDLTAGDGSPQNPKFIYGRAMAYEEIGEMDKALSDYAVSCQLAKRGCEKLGSGFKPSGSMSSSHLP